MELVSGCVSHYRRRCEGGHIEEGAQRHELVSVHPVESDVVLELLHDLHQVDVGQGGGGRGRGGEEVKWGGAWPGGIV